MGEVTGWIFIVIGVAMVINLVMAIMTGGEL